MKLKISASPRLLHVPAQFEVFATEQEAQIGVFGAIRNLTQNVVNIAILSGKNRTSVIAEGLSESLRARDFQINNAIVNSSTISEAERVEALIGNADIVIAVGGGAILDPAKLIASRLGLHLIVMPTALSSDCIGSPIAVLTDKSGRKISMPSMVPSVVIVDASVTTRCPEEMTLAGICDVLSNASALLDADLAQRRAAKKLDNFAIALSESAYKLLVPVDWTKINTFDSQKVLVKSLVLSGLAMGFSGDSVPCSGAEHSISHALDYLGYGEGSHGTQVGTATIYCHHLRLLMNAPGLPDQVISSLQSKLNVLAPSALGVSKLEFLEAVRFGVHVRPERYTILNDVHEVLIFEQAYDLAFDEPSVFELRKFG